MLGAAKPYRVILPVDYATSPSTRYPVLYLLHGLSDNSGTWTERTNVVDSAAGHRFIVVMPEGDVSWYTDSATVPTERYESYLLEELIPDVQKRYRTIEEGYARGIAGLSMGGYGSLKMALKHPDEFALAASMSGSVNAARYTDQDAAGWELHARSIARAFGAADSPTRAANDLFALLRARAPAGRRRSPISTWTAAPRTPSSWRIATSRRCSRRSSSSTSSTRSRASTTGTCGRSASA